MMLEICHSGFEEACIGFVKVDLAILNKLKYPYL